MDYITYFQYRLSGTLDTAKSAQYCNSVCFQPMGSYIGNETRDNPILASHLGSEFPGEKGKGVRMDFHEA
jgi:hypothetical protein